MSFNSIVVALGMLQGNEEGQNVSFRYVHCSMVIVYADNHSVPHFLRKIRAGSRY